MHVAESVLGFLEGGHGLESDAAGATIDLKHQRFAGAGADDLLHVREAVDRSPIDRNNHVARPEAGRLGGAARLDGVDPRRGAGLAEDHEESSENDDSQYEIRRRAGNDNGRPSPYRLMDKAVAAIFLAHGGNRGLVGHACGVIVAEEFYVSSERNSAQLPSGVVTIVEAKKFRAKSDRKHQDSHAAP